MMADTPLTLLVTPQLLQQHICPTLTVHCLTGEGQTLLQIRITAATNMSTLLKLHIGTLLALETK